MMVKFCINYVGLLNIMIVAKKETKGMKTWTGILILILT